MLSVVTVVTADNPVSIVLLVIRPLVGERGFATPTAGAKPTLESVILHYLR